VSTLLDSDRNSVLVPALSAAKVTGRPAMNKDAIWVAV